MKISAITHWKLQLFFFPLASGSSGLGASLTFSVSSSEKASVTALAAILADTLVGVGATAAALGLGVLTTFSAGLESVLSAAASSAESSEAGAGASFAFFCLPADLPRPRDLDLREPAAFFNTLESAL